MIYATKCNPTLCGGIYICNRNKFDCEYFISSISFLISGNKFHGCNLEQKIKDVKEIKSKKEKD